MRFLLEIIIMLLILIFILKPLAMLLQIPTAIYLILCFLLGWNSSKIGRILLPSMYEEKKNEK